MSEAFDKLAEKFNQLEQIFDKRRENKEERKRKMEEDTNDLYDTIQEKTDSLISKLEELKRKETIIITIQKIEPSVPENFPKNYYVQITYEDVVVTGNQKYTDFDENVIEEKFIIPLLTSSKAKVEVWTAEEEPKLFDKFQLDLEKIIEESLLNSDKFEDEINLNECPENGITFKVQLQGIGFSSWLKNLTLLRELETEKEIIKQEERKRRDQTRNKLDEKKKHFNQKFKEKKVEETQEYNNEEIDNILEILADD